MRNSSQRGLENDDIETKSVVFFVRDDGYGQYWAFVNPSPVGI
jgi:hypothetical protein